MAKIHKTTTAIEQLNSAVIHVMYSGEVMDLRYRVCRKVSDGLVALRGRVERRARRKNPALHFYVDIHKSTWFVEEW